MFNNIQVSPLVIAAGQPFSTPIWLGGRGIVAIRMPAAWTPAALTFQSAPNGEAAPVSPWMDLFDATGVEVQAAADASRHIAILPAALRGLLWVRLRSGTSAAPVDQAADREIILVHGGVA